MSFGHVQSNFITLKKRLAIVVGPNALESINIDPPKGDNDELSFIRLVAWTYVLLHESGRISLNFLRRLPPWKAKELMPHVRTLRTWMSHNLLFDRDHDMKTMSAAVVWFKSTCGAGTPQTPDQWSKCFSALCDEVNDILSNAIEACDAFDNPDDGERLKTELKEKLDRNWDAHQFDKHVTDALRRLQFEGFDVVAFRNRYLESWRKIVSTSVPEHIIRNLALRIEADVLSEMKDALPITVDEFRALTCFPNNNALVAALLVLKNQPAESRSSVVELIRSISSENKPIAASGCQ